MQDTLEFIRERRSIRRYDSRPVAAELLDQMLEAAMAGLKNKLVADVVAKSHVIGGTFAELKAVSNATHLEGQTIITSAVDDERLAFFTKLPRTSRRTCVLMAG